MERNTLRLRFEPVSATLPIGIELAQVKHEENGNEQQSY